ncbi:MAG: glucokinase [Methylibium sp.]|uniref:glucokinase n=1 Tax=Methylibium sp. TaxID=2067992 RepID=UPI00184C0B98|nr:glucokinase [Methylibium sp.]MBA2723618.1 glucokinase [Methylibium sp.]MBA3589977.1 glucokinase [Methylibium sp.]MBA3623196.1 glucokinase [Methylibium sp.]
MRSEAATASGFPRLLADIGGTRTRLGLQTEAGAAPSEIEVLQDDDHASLEAALTFYLDARRGPRARDAALAIATPVLGDDVRMTNRDWRFSISALQRALGFDRLVVINDFSALALALPSLQSSDLRKVGGGQAVPAQPLALIGPGTGLGVSGLSPAGGRWLPLASEGGHVTLAAADEREAALIALLRRRFGHVSAERALSGPGLANLHAALAELDGVAAASLDAPQIAARAKAGTDPLCVAAVETFFAMLGGVAGNLALTVGAHGGVFIGGGIVPRFGDWIGRSQFRERFEAKGRFREYLAAIPTFVVDAALPPALLGAAAALDPIKPERRRRRS